MIAKPRAPAGKQSKKKPGRGQAKARQRPTRWTVTLDPNASKRALRLRAGMMQPTKK